MIDRVYRELGFKVCSLWGMTESLASTLTEPERALEKSSKTDGRPLEGVAAGEDRQRPLDRPVPLDVAGEPGGVELEVEADAEQPGQVLGPFDIAGEPEDAVRVAGKEDFTQGPTCLSTRLPGKN